MNYDSIVILWSPRQKSFHRETLRETIQNGLAAFQSGALVDFFPVAICDTVELATSVLELFRWARVTHDMDDKKGTINFNGGVFTPNRYVTIFCEKWGLSITGYGGDFKEGWTYRFSQPEPPPPEASAHHTKTFPGCEGCTEERENPPGSLDAPNPKPR